jgi:hypothetical protein
VLVSGVGRLGSVFDRDDVHLHVCLADAVDAAKVATTGAVQSGELQSDWFAHSSPVSAIGPQVDSMTGWPTLFGSVRRFRLADAVQPIR